VHGYHRSVVVSRDIELGFRDLAPEPFPEFDHPGERDDVWFGVRCDVQFVAFGVLVRVVVPTNRPICKCAGRIRLCRAVVTFVGPPGRVYARSVRMQNTRTTVPSGYFLPSLTPARSSPVSEVILVYWTHTNTMSLLVIGPMAGATPSPNQQPRTFLP